MNALQAQHIWQYLTSCESEIKRVLKRLVLLETPTNDAGAQQQIMEVLKTEFEALDFHVLQMKKDSQATFLIAYPEAREKHLGTQLLIGHADTVWPKKTLDTMPLMETNEQIAGPGVFDMKAGIVQMIFAIKALRSLDFKWPLTPVVLINSDEEKGSSISTPAIRRLSKIACRAFILEPPLGLDGRLKTSRKGIAKFELIIKGAPAHAGLNPDKGASAIVELAHQIQKLFALNDFDRGVTVNVGMIEGGSSANVIAAESRAVIDVRVVHNEDAIWIEDQIRQLQPLNKDVELEIAGGFGRPPMERTERNQKLWNKASSAARLLNIELKQAAAGGGSDGNTTSLYTATLDGLGTVGDGAHARHEHIVKSKLIERTALLSLLLLAEKDPELSKKES